MGKTICGVWANTWDILFVVGLKNVRGTINEVGSYICEIL